MHDYLIDFLSLAPAVFVLVGLSVAAMLDRANREEQRRILLLVLLVEFLLVAQNAEKLVRAAMALSPARAQSAIDALDCAEEFKNKLRKLAEQK